MFRTLFIFALVVFTTFGAEEDDPSLGQDIGNEPIIATPAPVKEETKKIISLLDFYEPCKTPFVTQNVKPNWEEEQGFNENTTFYLPLASKGDMYRLTEQLYKTKAFDEFKEEHLTNSCFRFEKGAGSTLIMKAFNDKTFVKHLNNAGPHTFVFPPTYPGGDGGTAYTALTDNKSFTILTVCHNDGLGSFAVISPHKTLSPESLNTAKEILKAIGFKEEYFLEPNNDLDCESSPLEDVPVAKKYTPAPALLSPVPFAFGGFGNGIFGHAPITTNNGAGSGNGFNYPANTFFSSPVPTSHVGTPAQNHHYYPNYLFRY